MAGKGKSISQLESEWNKMKNQRIHEGKNFCSFEDYLDSYYDYITGMYDEQY